MKPILISHALCPYVQRAVIALLERDLPFERIDIDLRDKPAWFLALSPLGKTPVLKVGDQAIFESTVICEYLEDTTAPALHPEDPLARATHRAWIEFASTLLQQVWTFYTAKDIKVYHAAADTLNQRFIQIENELREGPYFAGARFSLVDAAFAPVFRYFDVFDEASGITFFGDTPKLRAWRRALSRRPTVRNAVSEDYSSLLHQFILEQHGVLAGRLAATEAI